MTYTFSQSVYAPGLLLVLLIVGVRDLRSKGFLAFLTSTFSPFLHRQTGTLWEGRYRATLIDTNGWRCVFLSGSSYRWHAGGKTDPLITDHRVYRALGKTAGARQWAYRELCRVPLEQESLVAIREATNTGWV